MDEKLKDLNKKIAALVDESKAIEALAKKEGRDLSAEEEDEIVAIGGKLEPLREERTKLEARIKARNEARAQINAAEEDLTQPHPARTVDPDGAVGANVNVDPPNKPKPWTIPAEARRYTPKYFTGPNADARAYKFGMWCLAAMGKRNAQKWCDSHGLKLVEVESAGHTTTDLGAGAVFVPDEFDNELLVLREQFGLFRQWARRKPMSGNTLSYNRRTGGLTASFAGEQQAGSTSTTTTDKVQLTAKDLYVFTTVTNQLAEDAVISLGDDMAREIAYAFATKEDQCGFNGDGTSTYGGIQGVAHKLRNLGGGTVANIAGLIVASGNLFSEFTLPDFNKVVGILPEYADSPNCAWYCHRVFWSSVMQKLMDAGGGNTNADIAAGSPKMFLGYPVRITQTMPKVDANSQIACLFGDLALAADFGDRKGMEMAFSQDATVDGRNMFMTNETAIRGVERFDINAHDVGNADATAANRVAGPIVGLISAAS